MEKEALQKIILESKSKKEAVEKLGFKSFLKVKKLCKNLGVDCSCLPQKKIGLSIEEKFNRQNVGTSQLKKQLIKAGLKKEECECCKNTQWNNQKIPLELHHKDGNRSNNKFENLEVLCPNCHALTETYKAKNRKNKQKNKRQPEKEKVIQAIKKALILKSIALESGAHHRNYDLVNKVIEENSDLFKEDIAKISSLEEQNIKIKKDSPKKIKEKKKKEWHDPVLLAKLVWEQPMKNIGNIFNVSDVAIKKFCIKNSIKIPPRGYWIRRKFGHSHEESLISHKRILKNRRSITKEIAQKALDLKKQGKTGRQIAKEIGFDRCSLKKAIERYNLQ